MLTKMFTVGNLKDLKLKEVYRSFFICRSSFNSFGKSNYSMMYAMRCNVESRASLLFLIKLIKHLINIIIIAKKRY